MTKAQLQAHIKELRELRAGDADYTAKITAELHSVNERLKVIAGENESLRMDKKWLQSMHSALCQAMVAKESNR